MEFAKSFRMEKVYFQKLKSDIDIAKSYMQAGAEDQARDVLESIVDVDGAVLLLYRNLGECWANLSDLLHKEDERINGLEKAGNDYHDEINQKIDEVNNYLMTLIRDLDIQQYEAGQGIMIDNDYTIFNESYLPYYTRELLRSGSEPDGGYFVDYFPLGQLPAEKAAANTEYPSIPMRTRRFVIKKEMQTAVTGSAQVPYALRIKYLGDPLYNIVQGVMGAIGCMNGNVILKLELEYKQNSSDSPHVISKSIIHPFNAIMDGDGNLDMTDVLRSYPGEINEIVDFSGIYTRNSHEPFYSYALRYALSVEGVFTFQPSIADSNCILTSALLEALTDSFNSPLYFNELTVPYEWR